VIRIDYEQLEILKMKFQNMADTTSEIERLLSRLTEKIDVSDEDLVDKVLLLERINSALIPEISGFRNALQDTSEALSHVSNIFEYAEKEAASVTRT